MEADKPATSASDAQRTDASAALNSHGQFDDPFEGRHITLDSARGTLLCDFRPNESRKQLLGLLIRRVIRKGRHGYGV
jgi:hypothetical protein